MQKKIIALAIASAITVPALAYAEATVYGQANLAYEMVDTGNSTAGVGTAADKRNQVSSYVSRLGFKGSEDLGDGLKFVYQFEGQVNIDDGSAGGFTFGRNTFTGIGSEYGTVMLGNMDTPYKSSTRKLDVFYDSIADNRSIMGRSHDTRLTNVFAYASPNISGFTGSIAYVGTTDNTLTGGAASTTHSAMSLAGNYAQDNFTVALATQTISAKDNAVPGNKGDNTATKLAGSYSMDAFTVGLVYEMLSNKVGTPGVKTERDNVYLGGTYQVSDAGTVKLAYTMSGESKTGGATNKGSGATQVSLGYDHALSKNTTVFALYTSVANDTAATYGLSTNSTGGFGTSVADKDPSAMAVGVRMKF